jgi:hypothetical protein
MVILWLSSTLTARFNIGFNFHDFLQLKFFKCRLKRLYFEGILGIVTIPNVLPLGMVYQSHSNCLFVTGTRTMVILWLSSTLTARFNISFNFHDFLQLKFFKCRLKRLYFEGVFVPSKRFIPE